LRYREPNKKRAEIHSLRELPAYGRIEEKFEKIQSTAAQNRMFSKMMIILFDKFILFNLNLTAKIVNYPVQTAKNRLIPSCKSLFSPHTTKK
jgi:hypothetical protein